MEDGKWVEPRHRDRLIFEKDYPLLDLNALDVKCPGCKNPIELKRKSTREKIAGWCTVCNRAVTA
ncbi:MAG: hypothetical protein ABIG11_03890 [bacterium]